GVPFREAHEIIGRLTAHCLRESRRFPDLSLEDFRAFSPAFDEDVFAVLTLTRALDARRTTGAPSPANVARELDAWRERLSAGDNAGTGGIPQANPAQFPGGATV